MLLFILADVSLLLFIFGALSVYRESLHQRLSEDLRQEQIRSKELINEGSNLEWRLAEHASTAVIKKNAQLELGMVPNGQSADEIFDYIYHEADIDRPHGGMMYIYSLLQGTRYELQYPLVK